jgi:hypothetical protein
VPLSSVVKGSKAMTWIARLSEMEALHFFEMLGNANGAT